ncbi:MAG TPA: rhomboid family intramembrane serine protease [Flavitalea sp.]|nr:rhomboid family intramembrane serine protease [Flavitalea sp.]
MKQIVQANNRFEFSIGLKSRLNLLILLHTLFFAAYYIIDSNGMLASPLAGGTVGDHLRNTLAVSSRPQAWPFNWTTSVFTYQFVHLDAGELLLSVAMLWLFGHLLKKRAGEKKVVLFYFILSIMSALVFNFSHLVFPIFSGPGGFMEGAFGGALGVMTAGVMLCGNRQFRIGKHIRVNLWQVYFVALLISFMTVYKNNMAYVLVYAFNIYMGIKYARILENRETNLSRDAKLAYQA